MEMINTKLVNFSRKVESDFEILTDSDKVSKMDDCWRAFLNGLNAHCNRIFSEEEFANTVNKWFGSLSKSLSFLKEMIRSTWYPNIPDQYSTFFHEYLSMACECRDESYMDIIDEQIEKICILNQEVFPFGFICAPSGSGKSIFAYNLGCRKYPALYLVNESNWALAQDIYKPFKQLSSYLSHVVEEDMLTICSLPTIHPGKRIKSLLDQVGTSSLDLISGIRPLCTVHYIVNLFTQLVELKSKHPKLTWIEIEMSIEEYHPGTMTIEDGVKALEDLNRSLNSILGNSDLSKKNPFVVFVDECILKRAPNNNSEVDVEKAAPYVFLRSVLRLMKTVPFFAGTDAKTSNFCTQNSSGVNPKPPIWALVLPEIPRFSVSLLKRQLCRVEKRFASRSLFERLQDFLVESRIEENPWLISLVIEFLMTEFDGRTFSLYALLNHLLRMFHLRKEAIFDFTRGQIAYTLNDKWEGGQSNRIVSNHGHELSINRHLAYMKAALLERPGDPFFFLRITARGVFYFRGTSDDYYSQVRFKPLSLFTSFTYAPITGLTLFGLSSEHRSLIVSFDEGKIYKVTSMDAILNYLWTKSHMITGRFLENLYTMAAVVASRIGGVNGATYLDFLGSFVRELSSMRISPDDALKEYKEVPLPVVHCDHNAFEDSKIPLLAPMAAPTWSSSAVALLKELHGQDLNLGTYQFTTKNDCVDHVIFSLDCQRMSSKSKDSNSEEEKTTVYNTRGDPVEIVDDVINGIPLIGECKCYNSTVPLMYILNEIVGKKFSKGLDEWKLMKRFPNLKCNLFQIVALKVSDFDYLSGKEEDSSIIKLLETWNDKNYYLWKLCKESPTSYRLEPLPRQRNRLADDMDVVIISIEEINGTNFVDGLKF